MPEIHVAVGVPTKGTTDAPAYDNHLTLLAHLGKLEVASQLGAHEVNGETFSYPEGVKFKFHLVTLPRVFPALARERIAEHARIANCQYLLMFDDDMILMPDLFERLFAHQKDIVAALAFTRLLPCKPVIYNLTKGWDAVERKDYYINHTVEAYPKDQLVQCDAVGFGAVLIKLSVLDALPQPWFMVTSGAGEDIHFCHQAGKAGFKIFMDTATKIGHLGERQLVTEETYESDENTKALRDLVGETKYKST